MEACFQAYCSPVGDILQHHCWTKPSVGMHIYHVASKHLIQTMFGQHIGRVLASGHHSLQIGLEAVTIDSACLVAAGVEGQRASLLIVKIFHLFCRQVFKIYHLTRPQHETLKLWSLLFPVISFP